LGRQNLGEEQRKEETLKTIKKLISGAFAAVILGMSTITANAALCTSTLGYWANHPNTWCVQTIQLGFQVYTKAQAIAIIGQANGGDRTYNLAAQLIAAKLNVNCSRASSNCVALAISNADAWLCQHPPGSNV